MKNYARVENHVVSEIVSVPDNGTLQTFFPANFCAVCFPCDSEVSQGWGYVDGVFSPPRSQTLDEAKSAKLLAIDADTSAAITAGFDFNVGGEALHFNYDAIDQQNFADTANAATLALMNVPGVPTSVTWNGWKADGSLTRLIFTAQNFLGLYVGGALAHKAACMENGGGRKAAVAAAQTIETLDQI